MFAEKSGTNFKKISESQQGPIETINVDEIFGVGEFGEESPTLNPMDDDMLSQLSDEDLYIILEGALGAISSEDSIDMLIAEFIENLKG